MPKLAGINHLEAIRAFEKQDTQSFAKVSTPS